jgi:hypothetical protein
VTPVRRTFEAGDTRQADEMAALLLPTTIMLPGKGRNASAVMTRVRPSAITKTAMTAITEKATETMAGPVGRILVSAGKPAAPNESVS